MNSTTTTTTIRMIPQIPMTGILLQLAFPRSVRKNQRVRDTGALTRAERKRIAKARAHRSRRERRSYASRSGEVRIGELTPETYFKLIDPWGEHTHE